MRHSILLFFALLAVSGCQKTPPPVPQTPCYGCGDPWGGGGFSYYTLRTYTSGDWDYWQYGMGDTTGWLRTYTSEDWDHWQFSLGGVSGTIKTYTSEDWDYWQLYSGGRTISIRTYTSGDWDYWEISEPAAGFNARMRTYTSNDFDHWEAYIGSHNVFDVRTYTSEDWDSWTFNRATGATAVPDLPQLAALLFVPVYTSAIHQRGIDL